ncbi:MAG: nucleotide pyrophosphohydrolase [Anaerolineae bacterium]
MDASDATTLVASLKEEVRQFIRARDWEQFHTPKDLAIGLITEAGELLEHFRFRSEAEVAGRLSDPAFQEALHHELADCLYFVLAISNKLNVDLSQAFAAKMALSARRYPVETARGRNEKYTDLPPAKT